MENGHLLNGETPRYGYSWRSQRDAHSIQSLAIFPLVAEVIMGDKCKGC